MANTQTYAHTFARILFPHTVDRTITTLNTNPDNDIYSACTVTHFKSPPQRFPFVPPFHTPLTHPASLPPLSRESVVPYGWLRQVRVGLVRNVHNAHVRPELLQKLHWMAAGQGLQVAERGCVIVNNFSNEE